MKGPIISLKNVSVRYPEGDRELRALDNVSLDIYPEEYVIFFGPSGCGKSTLLYAVAGLERPTEGTVNVLGRDLSTLSYQEIVNFHRKSIGMIFQAYFLIPSLSVRANVALPQIFLGLQKQERIKLGESLLERFHILEQKGKIPTQLSGGQQQRVAIARSLINDPPILLADEPVGNLDSKSAEDFMKLLEELNEKDKKTIVMVTHNPAHLGYAHRVFYMKDGKIVREVKNTERQQVREETMQPYRNEGLSELFKYYPHLDEESLKAKMIAMHLLEMPDIDVEHQIERLSQQYIQGKLTSADFISALSRSPRDGGVGLYEHHAERLADEIAAVLGMSKFLKKSFGTFPRNYEEYKTILERVSTYLALFSDAHLTSGQIEKLQAAIKGRLEGSLNRVDFTATLDKPFDDGGVGMNIRTARNIARVLELILVDYGRMTERQTIQPDQIVGALAEHQDAAQSGLLSDNTIQSNAPH